MSWYSCIRFFVSERASERDSETEKYRETYIEREGEGRREGGRESGESEGDVTLWGGEECECSSLCARTVLACKKKKSKLKARVNGQGERKG